jgi:hypothetical protein
MKLSFPDWLQNYEPADDDDPSFTSTDMRKAWEAALAQQAQPTCRHGKTQEHMVTGAPVGTVCNGPQQAQPVLAKCTHGHEITYSPKRGVFVHNHDGEMCYE